MVSPKSADFFRRRAILAGIIGLAAAIVIGFLFGLQHGVVIGALIAAAAFGIGVLLRPSEKNLDGIPNPREESPINWPSLLSNGAIANDQVRKAGSREQEAARGVRPVGASPAEGQRDDLKLLEDAIGEMDAAREARGNSPSPSPQQTAIRCCVKCGTALHEHNMAIDDLGRQVCLECWAKGKERERPSSNVSEIIRNWAILAGVIGLAAVIVIGIFAGPQHGIVIGLVIAVTVFASGVSYLSSQGRLDGVRWVREMVSKYDGWVILVGCFLLGLLLSSVFLGALTWWIAGGILASTLVYVLASHFPARWFTYAGPVSLSKSCGSCGGPISPLSRPGMTCPHCGVRWSLESFGGGPDPEARRLSFAISCAVLAFVGLCICWAVWGGKDRDRTIVKVRVWWNIQFLSDSHVKEAAHALGEIGPAAKEAVPALIRCLGNPNPRVQLAAAEALRKISPGDAEETISALVKCLGDANAFVRRDAACALGEIGPAAKKAVPALIQCLGDSCDVVPDAAVNALHRIGLANKESVPELITCLDHPDAHVRCFALLTLGEIGPAAKDAVPAMIKFLVGAETSQRYRAAQALGEIGPAAKDAVPALIKALGDRNVCVDAACALGKIGPAAKDAIPDLDRMATNDPEEFTRRNARDALEKIRK